jgi:hypothetical protein
VAAGAFGHPCNHDLEGVALKHPRMIGTLAGITVGPVVGVSFEVGGLRNARALIKKNTKQALAPYIEFYGHSFLLSGELSCGTWNEMVRGEVGPQSRVA